MFFWLGFFLKLFRYLAIIYPLQRFWWTESHTNCIICIIWILSFFIASPLLHYARAVPFNYSDLALYDCREEWEGELSSSIYTVIIFTITFFIPFTSLTFLYGSIGIKTFRKVQPGEVLTSMERVRNRIKIKVRDVQKVKQLFLKSLAHAKCDTHIVVTSESQFLFTTDWYLFMFISLSLL
jgi:hypothetical protein